MPTPPAFDLRRTNRTLISALLSAKAQFGGKRLALVDGDERKMTYAELVKAAFALGHALQAGTRPGEIVGVLLPTGAPTALTVFGLLTGGRVPAMLNFTAGQRSLKSACRTAGIKRIITAHRFIEKASLQDVAAALGEQAELVYLEDVRGALTWADKAAAHIGPLTAAIRQRFIKPEAPAIVLFTSGTEGEPKGVVLSHKALLANVEQVRCHIDLSAADILFNPLPMFHSFGLTVGVLMPLLLGVQVLLHPSPLQARTIAERIKAARATILIATDTFVGQYARAGDAGDLGSLRMTVCGGERVRDETRAQVRTRHGIELMEGYGVTEAAPVIAANQLHANKPGTVGKLMAGMEYKLRPVNGIEDGGLLSVRGPNVMSGYLSTETPGAIETPAGGWHETGDIVTVDEEGFISIKGRLKRFAKVGGEMVSLAVVENCAQAVWPDHQHAAIALPDERKGERIVLITNAPGAGRDQLLGWARNHGVPEIAVPRLILEAEAIPLLGTGKTDYVAVAALAQLQLAAVPGTAAAG